MPETIMESKDYKMAVLIDGDNAQASLLAKMLAEVGKHGSVTIRRIYGDWTTSNMHSWKDALHNFAVQPIQQFRYTVGKNATDSALIIDAMDIMHRKLVEGFCIISSDSDYTRLATRIREEGFFVMGIGQKKTPKSFVNGCDLFIYTENLSPRRESKPRQEQARGRGASKKGDAPQPQQPQPLYAGTDPMPLLREAYEMVVQENGWANLGPMGKALLQLDPGF
ncbi:MAG: NYN domain-containing protein, partial [Chrysiogenales bacterium]